MKKTVDKKCPFCGGSGLSKYIDISFPTQEEYDAHFKKYGTHTVQEEEYEIGMCSECTPSELFVFNLN